MSRPIEEASPLAELHGIATASRSLDGMPRRADRRTRRLAVGRQVPAAIRLRLPAVLLPCVVGKIIEPGTFGMRHGGHRLQQGFRPPGPLRAARSALRRAAPPASARSGCDWLPEQRSGKSGGNEHEQHDRRRRQAKDARRRKTLVDAVQTGPSRIVYPAPRTVCSSGLSKLLSILALSRETCTSMTLVCGSK